MREEALATMNLRGEVRIKMGRMVMSEDSGSGEQEALGNCGDYGTRKRQLTCKLGMLRTEASALTVTVLSLEDRD